MLIKYQKGLYSYEDKKFSEKGSRTVSTFVLDFPDRGGVCLKKTGEKPLYEMIQANLVNCDLNSVIESCVHSNQYAVCTEDNLNSLIMDYTGVSNLGDLYASTKRIEHTWKELPLEVRESFDSDIKKFIRGIGTSDFNDKVSSGFAKFNDNISKNNITDVVPPTVVKPDVEVPTVEVPINVPVDTGVKVEVN